MDSPQRSVERAVQEFTIEFKARIEALAIQAEEAAGIRHCPRCGGVGSIARGMGQHILNSFGGLSLGDRCNLCTGSGLWLSPPWRMDMHTWVRNVLHELRDEEELPADVLAALDGFLNTLAAWDARLEDVLD